MKHSSILNSLPPYPFAKLEALISQKRQEGVDLISFGIGDPDLKTPNFINNALIEGLSIPGNHNYSSSSGEKSFRDSISIWFENICIDNVRYDFNFFWLKIINFN